MKDKSKNSLIYVSLLAIAVVVLTGYIGVLPTGFATSGEGYVSVDVAGSLAITLPDNQINLSLHPTDTANQAGGYVNLTQASATIDSEGNNDGHWLNASDGYPRSIAPDNITINNTGTVTANITITSGSTPDTFFGAAGGAFYAKITETQEPNSCVTGDATNWKQYQDNATNLCERLIASDATDLIEMWIQWTVPAGVGTGTHNSTVTIDAAESI